MAKSSKKPIPAKIIALLIVAFVLAAAGFGYLRQTSKLGDEHDHDHETTTQAAIDPSLLAPRPNDIILGDANAPVTVVEYSSLSCSHCANFHQEVLPTLEKEFITTGKVKLVLRHFPLNEPAMRAAQLVECAGKNGLDRKNFMKVFFTMQKQWAFDANFLANIKQISLVGGIDAASFDSCISDKDTETAILSARQEAETLLHVTGTPFFFINGEKYEGQPTVSGLSDAIKKAIPNA